MIPYFEETLCNVAQKKGIFNVDLYLTLIFTEFF